MKLNRVIKIFLITVLMCQTTLAVAGVVVISHPDLNMKTLGYKELRYIYSMQIKFWHGKKIQVITLPSKNSLHQQFSTEQMVVTHHMLDRLWNRLKYSGIAAGPLVVENEKQMVNAVKNLPGAIGYVSDQYDLSGVSVNKVEIIK